jgi:hypothetical protein
VKNENIEAYRNVMKISKENISESWRRNGNSAMAYVKHRKKRRKNGNNSINS